MAQYQIEAVSCVSDNKVRAACFRIDDDNQSDLVAMDVPVPIIAPCVIEVNSKGEVRKIIWRVT